MEGLPGTASRIQFIGAAPLKKDEIEPPLSLPVIARYQLMRHLRQCLGYTLSRRLFQQNPAQFLANTAFPVLGLAQKGLTPEDPNMTFYNVNHFELEYHLFHWQNMSAPVYLRRQSKRFLTRMFPLNAMTPEALREVLFFSSYQCFDFQNTNDNDIQAILTCEKDIGSAERRAKKRKRDTIVLE